METAFLIPSTGGVYILYERGKIYIGFSLDLKRRVLESIQERRFESTVKIFCWTLPYDCNLEKKDDLEIFLRVLEHETITAMHTIIYGNALERQFGLHIINDVYANDSAQLLPASACDEGNHYFDLPIEIVQTFLKDIGVPEPLTGLPYYPLLLHPDFPKMSKLFGHPDR
ncbi:hypothetical protein EOK75_20205 (plasmid) [Pseudorhodobacter turbinis]|uniref:GIY-YIG domain-containing protein n=2 Tax=Pseudorhodobacter turbinis TaxID=2500533 RepID=A0A4P8ELD7_9RHOB|nr:hypothetical protein EOK75_20205 [Pseudorhodobacter turbinis]